MIDEGVVRIEGIRRLGSSHHRGIGIGGIDIERLLSGGLHLGEFHPNICFIEYIIILLDLVR